MPKQKLTRFLTVVNFRQNFHIFLVSAQNIDCGYSLEVLNVGGFSGHFFSYFLNLFKLFCLVVATCMSDLVHNVEAIHGLCKLLTVSGNLF